MFNFEKTNMEKINEEDAWKAASEGNQESREVKSKIDRGWDESRQNEVIKGLNEGGDLQKIMESFPGFKESFSKPLDTIDCSDGRVLKGGKIGVAGSGILLPDVERDLFIKRFKGNVPEITAHDDCGAAALAFKSLRPEEIPEGVSNSDEYGAYRAQKLAEDLVAEYKYLKREDMAEEYHNEAAIVLDQTVRFDSTNLAGFPAHFVCTGAGLGFSREYMKTEMSILSGIALGHHGFGDRFGETQENKNPFYILVAADSQEQLEVWMDVAEEVAENFNGKIIVKGFIAPVKE